MAVLQNANWITINHQPRGTTRRRGGGGVPIGILFILLIGLSGLWIYPSSAAGRRWSSSLCQSDSECPPHAICDSHDPSVPFGTCICRPGYVFVAENETKECHPIAEKLGDECLYDIQCHERFSTESECWKGRCNCKLGSHHVPMPNKCYTSVRIGDFCRLTNNCIGEGTLCKRGVCTCPYTTHANGDFTECISDRQLEENCATDTECVVPFSKCDQVCRCAADYVISENRSTCLRVANRLYGSCEESVQCKYVSNSFCDTQSDLDQGGFCQCRSGFHNVNNTCYVTVDLGGICERNENCERSAGTICKSGRCICDDDYPEIDGYCSSASRAQSDRWTIQSQMIFLSNLLFLLFINSCS